MKNRKVKHLVTAITLGCTMTVATGFMLTGCGEKEEPVAVDPSVEVVAELPKTGDIEVTGEFVGTVEADTEIQIIPKVSGDVTATYFEEGDTVSEGDLLFSIDDASAQITLNQAQASMASANAQVESAAAQIESAQATVESAQQALLYTQAKIEENIGTMDTTEMQYKNAVASKKYALNAAGRNVELTKEQLALAIDNYKDLEDSIDNYKDSASSYEDYAEELEDVSDTANDIASCSSLDDALDMLDSLGIDYDASEISDEEDAANHYISEMTNGAASSQYALGVMKSSATASASSARSSAASADNSKDSAKLSQIQAAIAKETAADDVLSAADAEALAERTLSDYTNFTRARIIASANADLASANSSVVTAQSSVKQAEASEKQAQASVAQAQATIDNAQLALDYYQIKSPVNGKITKKSVTTHNMATTGSAAYVIQADEGMSITFNVAENVMREISVGDEVTVERNGKKYKAVISENTGISNGSTGLFEVKANINDNADDLIVGSTVKLTLVTQKSNHVMTIPSDAVYYASEMAYVYAIKDGKAIKTEVEVGLSNENTIEVKSGITADTQVITSWASDLRDGSLVKEKGETTNTAAEAAPEKESTVTKETEKSKETVAETENETASEEDSQEEESIETKIKKEAGQQ